MSAQTSNTSSIILRYKIKDSYHYLYVYNIATPKSLIFYA